MFSRSIINPIRQVLPHHRHSLTFFPKSFCTWGEQFNVPQLHMEDYVNGQKKFPFFSILNAQNIIQTPKEISDQFKAVGTINWEDKRFRTIDKLVVFNPLRQAKQLTAILASLSVKIKDGKHFVEICHQLNKKINPIVTAQLNDFKVLHHETAQLARDAFEGHLYDTNALFNAIEIRKREGILLGDKRMVDTLITQIIANDLYRDLSRAKLHPLINDILTREIEQHHLEALPEYPAHTRVTQMVAGGPATGKSFLMKQSATWFEEEHGFPLTSVANISPDRYRLTLLDDPSLGSDKRIHGTLTHAEARFMTDEAIRIIEAKLTANELAPHIYIEQMNAANSEVSYGTMKGSKLFISVTSYPPIEAIQGNLRRYNDTQKRLVPIDVILKAIRDVSKTIPQLLQTHQGMDISLSIYNTFKMIHDGLFYQHALIAQVDCSSLSMKIYNIEEMLAFIKNSYIDPTAKNSAQLYPVQAEITTDSLVNEFIEQYKHYNWLFIEPGTNTGKNTESQANVYATYSAHEGLCVKNERVFDWIMSENKQVSILFEALHSLTLGLSI